MTSTSASGADRTRVGGAPAKREADETRADDEGLEPRERDRDRVGKAERQERRVRIVAQETEGQDDQSREHGAAFRRRRRDRHEKPVAAARQRLDELWRRRVVPSASRICLMRS